MHRPIFYLETGSTDPAYNLAFEEAVLHHCPEGDYLLLWQNCPTVVIGQNQIPEAEIHQDFVCRNGIRVIRRATGGGAVYHDLGNLNYSFITDWHCEEDAAISRFTAPIVKALRDLGLDAEATGRNDILVSGQKVSGTAQRFFRHRILHHGTLLFDSDLAMAAEALRSDPEKFRAKNTPSVRSRIGNIREHLTEDMALPAFWQYLKNTLAGNGLHPATLPEATLAEAQRLKEEKYDSWEWNFGRTPQYQYTNKARFPGGTLEVRLDIAQGRIQNIAFLGDFLSACSLHPVEAALKGCPCQRADAETILAQFSLRSYFGQITRNEILDTIFA